MVAHAQDEEAARRPTAARPINAPAATDLQYERGAAGTVSVRGFRLLVALTLVNTVLLGSMVLGPQLFPFARQQLQQWKDARAARRQLQSDLAARQKCQDHLEPASKVVYEEDPREALKLIKASPRDYERAQSQGGDSPPGWQPAVRLATPDHYEQFRKAVYGRPSPMHYSALAFLHERTTPAGERFVVAVSLQSDVGFSRRPVFEAGPSTKPIQLNFSQRKQRMLVAESWPLGNKNAPPAEARQKVRLLRVPLSLPDNEDRIVARLKPDAPLESLPPPDPGNRLRLFAGQPDPADPSHFTIGYDLDGRPGVIDGWLRDEGIELRPREGQSVYEDGGGAWRLPAAQAPSHD